MTYYEYLNYYTVLNISPGASKEEIKAAYLLLAKQFHPDHVLDEKEKKHAEEKFKLIAQAYDQLKSVDENYSEFINASSFYNDFKQESSEIVNMPKDSAAFFKFYFAQQEQKMQDKKTSKSTKTTKTTKTAQKTKNSVPPEEDFLTQSIKAFEKYIKENKLNMMYVYECIRTNTAIVTSTDRLGNVESYSSILVKEILYRRHAKTTEEYQMFLRNKKFFKKIDLTATLYVDINYPKKKFDEAIKYKIKEICPNCKNAGCKQCKNGYKEVDYIRQIKVPYVSEKPLYYEIKNGGNHSSIGNGKLFLKVIYVKSKINESGYEFSVKHKREVKIKPIVEMATKQIVETSTWAWAQLKTLYSLILTNKHVSALYIVIGLLLVTIICLAVLL